MSDELVGGDMRVRVNSPCLADASSGVDPIDANSVASGDYTQERVLPNGSKIYFTPDGADAYDELRNANNGENGAPLSIVAETDPNGIFVALLKLVGLHKGNEDRFKGRVNP
jgi:hypothetical protein